MHTTQQPPPLTNVPTVVEDIVLRLLQKDPENRYQSCRGLLFDLEECQRRTKWGEIEPFKIGTMDYADFSHTISNGFYGRGAERDRLNNAFNRAIVTGKSEMILISGESGIGKSTFIYKFYHQRVERGFFAYGKFEQDIQTKLYSAIMDALRGVISQICEDRNEMEKWRIKILHAISNNGQILIELLPELEEVIGKQNLVEKLGTKETKSRLDKTLCNFVNILGSVGSPLILFLDDLQCADRDSVMLIESLVTTNENLFFIGAYRSNEISKNTNMTQMIERMKELVKVETLELRPIEPKQVEKWVQDILVGRTKRRSSFPFNSDVPDSNKELAKLIHKKTGGNPYFIQLYMSALYRDGVIVPDGTLWKWSRQELESTMMNSNLEQLLEQRVARLPLKTRTTLQWGSCMGINFDLLMVTHVMNLQLEDVIKSLQSAIDLSMITIAKDVIQFTHDRIREAFYVSIPDKARMKFHHSIGMMLLTQSLDNKGRLLAIDHINKGRTVIDDSVQERFDMAERNLWASKQSQEAGSHSASLKYALAGVEWIKNTKSKEELWNDHFELMFALHYEIADNYLLLSEFKEFEPVANELLEHAKTNLEIGKVQHIRMMSASMQKDFTKAVEIGSFMIGLYGLEFPINNPERIGELKIKAHEEFETIFRQLERCDDGHLDLKKLVKKLDEETVILYEFLVTICFAGIFADTELAALMCVTSLNIMLTKGINAKAATIAAQYAQTLIQMKKYDLAKELSIIALECANLFKESVVDCVRATHFYNLLVRHWFRPVKEVLASARDLYQRGISTGEMFMSAFALTTEPMVQLFHGFNLTQTHRSATSVFNIAQHHKIVIIEETTSVLVLICDLWQNRFVQEPDVVLQEAMSKYKINSIKTVISAAVSWLSFVYGEDFDPQKSTLSAIEHVNNELTKIETNYEFVKYRSTLLCCMYNLFYTTLQLLRLYRALNGVQGAEELQESVKTKIYEKEQDLQEWAKYCPQNYLDNLLLVRAEIAAYITCEKLKAIELYEQYVFCNILIIDLLNTQKQKTRNPMLQWPWSWQENILPNKTCND
jgi:predicted ATPase